MKNPKLITKPFAQNGQKNAIPENFSSSMESNQATWDTGFGQITMIPVAAGGMPPKGQDFNGIFNQLSENIIYLSKGGKFKFSADYAASINGYPKGAILQSDDETKEYQSKIDNNKVNFNTATQSQINAAWKLVSTDDLLQQIAGKQPAGDYATKTELSNGLAGKQPSGSYATTQQLNDGLGKKFDKTGGSVDGHVTASGNIQSNSGKVTANLESATGIQLDGTGSVAKIRGRVQGGLWHDHFLPEKAGTFQQIGDFGLGVANYPASGVSKLNETMFLQYGSTPTATSEGFPGAGGGIQISYRDDKRAQLFINRNPLTLSYRFSDVAGKDTVTPWVDVLSTSNTIVDRNGNLKTTGATELSDYPVGAPIPWPHATAPSGFLVCNGQSFNKTTYPLLASAYPSGALPDLRAEFIRGLDAGRGIDGGREALSVQGDAMRKITGGNIRVWASADSSKPTGAFNGSTSNNGAPGSGSTPLYEITFDSERVVPTAAEVRPRNKAFLYIVRAA